MFRACLETAAAQPDSLPAIGLYFELWLLRLGGYLPNWSNCSVCERAFNTSEAADLQSSFHLICSGCRRAKGSVVVEPIHRELFSTAQSMSPSDFIDHAAVHPDAIDPVSRILRRILSHAVGRDLTAEKSLLMSVTE
jgi:DNA repair protein RecO (recombination protein O)